MESKISEKVMNNPELAEKFKKQYKG